MDSRRAIIRVLLLTAFILSVIIIAYSVLAIKYLGQERWSTIAAALAVIAATISAWTSQRIFELQEDAQKPYPYPSIDVRSRSQLLQLRLTNGGGTAAHNIRFSWDEPLLNREGKPVRFTKIADSPDIPILLPNESTSVLVDSTVNFFKKYKDTNYLGVISFNDPSGKYLQHPFSLSAEMYRNSMVYDTDEAKTHDELQKIPHEISKLVTELQNLQNLYKHKEE